jgi:hypothetical protein
MGVDKFLLYELYICRNICNLFYTLICSHQLYCTCLCFLTNYVVMISLLFVSVFKLVLVFVFICGGGDGGKISCW